MCSIAPGALRADEFPTGLRILPDFLQRLARLPIISIASIRGRARGIGAEFVEGLDIHFGSREKMILGQIDVGSAVVPGSGGCVYLPLLVGRSRALEIIVGTEDYNADTAERYGWILQTIPLDAAACMESSSVTVPINSRTQLTPLSLGKSCLTCKAI